MKSNIARNLLESTSNKVKLKIYKMVIIQELRDKMAELSMLIDKLEYEITQENPYPEIEMVHIPGGTFMMGSEEWNDSKPVHSVTLSPFKMGKYPVTQKEWMMVMGNNPSEDQSDDYKPVTNVSWDDVQQFIQKLNKLTGKNYRLPSEAEWEYACADSVIGWNYSNCKYLMPVGILIHNKYGLNDMLGNVWEWCEDDWHDNYQGAPTDGRAWVDSPRGNGRVLRGGSWFDDGDYCRSAVRGWYNPGGRDYGSGFRVSHD